MGRHRFQSSFGAIPFISIDLGYVIMGTVLGNDQDFPLPKLLVVVVMRVEWLFGAVAEVGITVIAPVLHFEGLAEYEGNVLERIEVAVELGDLEQAVQELFPLHA
jgi:hypothetical protein